MIHDAAGDGAEIIFGAVNDAAMHGEVRITVIATGFDRLPNTAEATPAPLAKAAPNVLPFRDRVARPAPAPPAGYPKPAEAPARKSGGPPEVSEMEIPTFIRRQMD